MVANEVGQCEEWGWKLPTKGGSTCVHVWGVLWFIHMCGVRVLIRESGACESNASVLHLSVLCLLYSTPSLINEILTGKSKCPPTLNHSLLVYD